MTEGLTVDGQPRKRSAPQPLTLRDLDDLLMPKPIVRELPLEAFVLAGGDLPKETP